ncbi:hypothetical protein [uncultured Sphingomonas sp.]|uniref:hypothetical protein n=1 Tax=uncultured Sphingomonas sp. TaxID=158754 RepID=UPI0035CA6D7C
MTPTRMPIWTARPTRFAALPPGRARATLALLVLLLAACLLALRSPSPPPVSGDSANRAEDQADVVLYQTIVEQVRHGGDYYAVTAQALRTGDYPLRPFVTFRLPTLAAVQARLPDLGSKVLLYALAAGTAIAWWMRLVPAFGRAPPRVVALLLLSGGMLVFVQAELMWFHEVWAGLLIALSLALRRPGRWVEAVAFGLAATLVRETAALYVGVMAAAAWAEGERREATGWALAAAVLAVVVAAHAYAVAQVVRPLDPASAGWAGMLGFGFFVRTMTLSTALSLPPLWLAAPMVGLALFGWAAWAEPLAARALATFAAYAVLLGVAGRVDTFYWGLLVAGPLLVGLAFVPDGLRDLSGAAASGRRRRITVTRLVQ